VPSRRSRLNFNVRLHLSSRIHIRPPVLGDQREFIASAKASLKLHQPWAVAPSTPLQFRTYVERTAQPGNVALLICRRDTDQIVGVVNVTNIVLGLFRSAYLGYYAFAGHEGQGFMREGLQAVIRQAFHSMKLHRLEANIQPGNTKSLSLVKACGFSKEGYSPRYLKIGGRWRDHERWAILAS
jgi:ribosomal-protein-alanine N-acetyltransferase